MKKYILGLFLVGFILAPWLSFATTAGDVDPNPQASDCVSIVNNLRYKDRDMNKNGEVSTLQDFLQSKNYLNNEPTGYFGILTVKAVKDFQKASGINPTGYVGQITRDKIVSITCEGGVHPNNPIIDGISGPQTLNVNQAGTWTVKASDPNGGSLSYSVNWGDQNAICRADSDCLRTTAIPQSQQLATFTHSYTRAGTFRPTFTIMSDNGIRCFTTPCSTGGSATTSTVVKVGNVVPVSSITVSSPNGGEVLTKGTNQIIKWQDNETFSCPVGAPCVQPLDRYYDISLFSYYPTCTGGDCHMIAMPYHAPQIIAQNVLGTSFNWQVGEVINNTGASDNIAAMVHT